MTSRRELRRLNLAMLCAALAAFGMLYATQGLLPAIGADFGVGPTAASLTVSAATGALALTILPLSWAAESLVLAAIATAVAGLLLTLPDNLALVVVGLLVFTGGFFGAHAVASGWVTHRGAVRRGQAAAMYLLAYYLGSSVFGAVIGIPYQQGGWPAAVAAIAGLFALAALSATAVRPARRPG